MENTLFALQAGVSNKDWLILCQYVMAVKCYCVVSRFLCPCGMVQFIFTLIFINLTLHFDLSVISALCPMIRRIMKKSLSYEKSHSCSKMLTCTSTLTPLPSSFPSVFLSFSLFFFLPLHCLYFSFLLHSFSFRLQDES